MNKDFIPGFIAKGYELKKQCRIDITSCVNYTYYIVYKTETKDLLILEDTHACHATTPPEPKIIHLEDIYKTLYYEINSIEDRQAENYETYQYKNHYRNKEQFEDFKQHGIKWHQEHVTLLQDFINTYLKLLKNRYIN